MKRYCILALALVLTAGMLVGCGCTNRRVENTTVPTVLPTNEEIWNTSEATTHATTEHTTATHGTEPSETINHGNGPLEETITGTTGAADHTEATAEGRARSAVPKTR